MYRRFLNNGDYLGIITQEALTQLTRGVDERFVQAEQAAEASIVDYLSENYEVEKELLVGKKILEYHRGISYPVGVCFYYQNQICQTLKAISGYKEPSAQPYWHEYEDVIDVSLLEPYSQLKNYHQGEMVGFLGKAYMCDITHGFDMNNIRIPNINAWEIVPTTQWSKTPFLQWEVVQYQNDFYTLMTLDEYDPFATPIDSPCWGLIGEYDNTLDSYELSGHDYVVYGGDVYKPIINPNATTPEIGSNIRAHDPRNYNLKRHMVQLSLYELHKLISPTNISSVRIDDYEHSMQWLKDASKLKLNPQIPRKVGNKDNLPITDWQMATFQSDYDPYNNPWQV